MSDLQSLAEKSLWKIEEGLAALPECIDEGAKIAGADAGDVLIAHMMADAVKAQMKALHEHLAASATRAGAALPRSGGTGKTPPP